MVNHFESERNLSAPSGRKSPPSGGKERHEHPHPISARVVRLAVHLPANLHAFVQSFTVALRDSPTGQD